MSEEKNADVVFVLDASDSMKPCFNQLRDHLKAFVKPFREEGYTSLRLGLLAYNAGPNNGKWAYRHTFINGDAPQNMNILYGDDEDAKTALFTRSGNGDIDIDGFCERLDKISCCADENSPLALDCAADFPFEPLCNTRRVIVMFTDEKLEDGVLKDEVLGPDCSVFEKVMQKIQARHITLYFFGPDCAGVEMMGEFSRVYINTVKDYHERAEGEDVWAGIKWDDVLEGMGRQISGSIVQMVEEPAFTKAVYGQDKWPLESWGLASNGGVIDITDVPEGVELDTSEPIEWVNAKMRWHTPIDLDIHAFALLNNGESLHVFYGDKRNDYMFLDRDAGVGDKLDSPEGNEENIRCIKFDGVERILIATKIYREHGCFSDYRGTVEVTTSNQRQQRIDVQMESTERLDWCVIAMIDNSDPTRPRVYPINQVVADEPRVEDAHWRDPDQFKQKQTARSSRPQSSRCGGSGGFLRGLFK